METIQGVVTQVELKSRAPFRRSRYSQGEQREFYLEVVLETDTDTVYVNSPSAHRTVTMGGPIAVVVYRVTGKAATWMEEVGERKYAEAGKPNDNHLEPLLKEGDYVTVEGRIKAERVSRRGNPYRVVNHASLVKVEDNTTRILNMTDLELAS